MSKLLETNAVLLLDTGQYSAVEDNEKGVNMFQPSSRSLVTTCTKPDYLNIKWLINKSAFVISLHLSSIHTHCAGIACIMLEQNITESYFELLPYVLEDKWWHKY